MFGSLAMAAAKEGSEKAIGVVDAIVTFFVWLIIAILLSPWPWAVYATAAGLFSCFLAHRFLAHTIVFWGIAYGVGVGGVMALLTPELSQAWTAGYIAIGAVAGVGVVLILHHVSQFLIGAIWSASAMAVIVSIIPIPYVGGLFILGAAVWGGVRAYQHRDEVFILTSAIWGAELAVDGVISIVRLFRFGNDALLDILIGLSFGRAGAWDNIETDEDLWLAIIRTASILVLSAAGIYVQFRIRNSSWWMKSLRAAMPTDEDPPSAQPDGAVDERPGYGWSGARGLPVKPQPEGELEEAGEQRPKVEPGPLLEPRGKKITIKLTPKPEENGADQDASAAAESDDDVS